MKSKIMLFSAAFFIAAISAFSTTVVASEPASCPTANCDGGNLKCCSNRAGDIWYMN